MATTRSNPQKSLWLLALDASQTYVVYQPHPQQVMPLALETPLGRVSTLNFPFGKAVLRKLRAADGETVHLEIDAEYPPQAAMAAELEILRAGPGHGRRQRPSPPRAVREKDERGAWHISPYADDTN